MRIDPSDDEKEVDKIFKEFAKAKKKALTTKKELIDLARRIGLLEQLLADSSGDIMEKRVIDAIAEDEEVRPSFLTPRLLN